jgi:hypothetical protein
MRADCQPCFVNADGGIVPLHRVEFKNTVIAETFLQEQLHQNPSLLPVRELNDSFAPLLSLGREIENIDNLFISPSGRIVIVETKLWRNPEATRNAVAQILEYAGRLQSLTYEKFEKACRSALKPSPFDEAERLFDLVKKKFPNENISEPSFIDSVQRNLRDARFMLLIVGDGIKENIEDILTVLHQNPQMLFTFGLVEMQIYERDGIPGWLIVPRIVARTKEIIRAVVEVKAQGEAKVSVTIPPEEVDKARTLSEQEFLDAVKDSIVRDLFARLMAFTKEFGHLDFTKHSVSARLPFYGTGEIRFFRLWPDGGIVISNFGYQLRKRGLPDDLGWEVAKNIAELFPGVGVKPDKPEITRPLRAEEVVGRCDEFVAIYRRAIEELLKMSPATVSVTDKDDADDAGVRE